MFCSAIGSRTQIRDIHVAAKLYRLCQVLGWTISYSTIEDVRASTFIICSSRKLIADLKSIFISVLSVTTRKYRNSGFKDNLGCFAPRTHSPDNVLAAYALHPCCRHISGNCSFASSNPMLAGNTSSKSTVLIDPYSCGRKYCGAIARSILT